MTSKYLQFTKYVNKSKEILNLANKLKLNNKKYTLINITKYLKSLPYTGYKKDFFRKRKSSEILKSGFLTGCTDAALLFMSIGKTLEYPVKYIETIRKINSHEGIEGHIFVDIYFDKKWHKYDPLSGFVKDYNIYGKCKIVYKGLDFTCLKKRNRLYCLDSLKKLKIFSQKVLR